MFGCKTVGSVVRIERLNKISVLALFPETAVDPRRLHAEHRTRRAASAAVLAQNRRQRGGWAPSLRHRRLGAGSAERSVVHADGSEHGVGTAIRQAVQ